MWVCGILAFTERNEIQMLAMIARKHIFFDRLFHKSITKEMTKLSRITVFSAPRIERF